jgi:hypothetical protein
MPDFCSLIGCSMLAYFAYRIIFIDYYEAKRAANQRERNLYNPIDLIRWITSKIVWVFSWLIALQMYLTILVVPFFFVLAMLPTIYLANKANITLLDIVTLGQADGAAYTLEMTWPMPQGLKPLPENLPKSKLLDSLDHEVLPMLFHSGRVTVNDLENAEKVIEKAFPSAKAREELQEWASRQIPILPIKVPDEPFFRNWLILDGWYLNETHWKERQTGILKDLGGETRFGRSLWAALLNYGEDVAQERGWEGLLQVQPDRARAIAAIDRLSGRDAFSDQVDHFCRDTRPIQKPPKTLADVWSTLAMFASAYYPNDDVPYLALGEGFKFAVDGKQMSLPGRIATVLGIVILALLVQRGMRLVTIRLLGRIFRVRKHVAYQAYESHAFDPYWQLGTIVMVIIVSYPLSRLMQEPFYILFCRSEGTFLAATVWGVMMGSILVEAIESVITLWFIRNGKNPLEMVLDNMITAGLSMMILLFFQNSLKSVLIAISVGLASSIWHKWKHRNEAKMPVFELAE